MTIDNSNKLAIVIPAYKARFLRQALESISGQTDKRFTVYIGDDSSPDKLEEICHNFSDRFDFVYNRFPENLGQKSLIAHWNRCIEMSSEPWIWLFSDDDVMEPKCVEKFYHTIERERETYRVVRFNTLTINDYGEVIRINPPHPQTESGIQFIYHRLNYERESFVSEYIFSRKSYLENKGFIDFPIAYCSDDASWLAFSGEKGIFTIQGAKVYWRRSAINICPSGVKYQTERIEATFSYLNWLDNYIRIHGTGSPYITRDLLLKLAKNWFLKQIEGVAPINFSNYFMAARYMNSFLQIRFVRSYYLLLKMNSKSWLFKGRSKCK